MQKNKRIFTTLTDSVVNLIFFLNLNKVKFKQSTFKVILYKSKYKSLNKYKK